MHKKIASDLNAEMVIHLGRGVNFPDVFTFVVVRS